MILHISIKLIQKTTIIRIFYENTEHVTLGEWEIYLYVMLTVFSRDFCCFFLSLVAWSGFASLSEISASASVKENSHSRATAVTSFVDDYIEIHKIKANNISFYVCICIHIYKNHISYLFVLYFETELTSICLEISVILGFSILIRSDISSVVASKFSAGKKFYFYDIK